MGHGGVGDHIPEYRSCTFRRFTVCRVRVCTMERVLTVRGPVLQHIILVLKKTGDGNLCVSMCHIQKGKSLGSTRRYV